MCDPPREVDIHRMTAWKKVMLLLGVRKVPRDQGFISAATHCPKNSIRFLFFLHSTGVFSSFPPPKTHIHSDLISYDTLFPSFSFPTLRRIKPTRILEISILIIPQTSKLRHVRLQWEYFFALTPKWLWFSRISQDC